jgi:hypothetical protein
MPKFFINGRWNGHFPIPLEKHPREGWDPIRGWLIKPAERKRYAALRACYLYSCMPELNAAALARGLLAEDGVKEGSRGYAKKLAARDKWLRRAIAKYIR